MSGHFKEIDLFTFKTCRSRNTDSSLTFEGNKSFN